MDAVPTPPPPPKKKKKKKKIIFFFFFLPSLPAPPTGYRPPWILISFFPPLFFFFFFFFYIFGRAATPVFDTGELTSNRRAPSSAALPRLWNPLLPEPDGGRGYAAPFSPIEAHGGENRRAAAASRSNVFASRSKITRLRAASRCARSSRRSRPPSQRSTRSTSTAGVVGAAPVPWAGVYTGCAHGLATIEESFIRRDRRSLTQGSIRRIPGDRGTDRVRPTVPQLERTIRALAIPPEARLRRSAEWNDYRRGRRRDVQITEPPRLWRTEATAARLRHRADRPLRHGALHHGAGRNAPSRPFERCSVAASPGPVLRRAGTSATAETQST